MYKRSLPLLIAVNIILLAALAVVSFTAGPVQAQLGRRGGNYMMIGGKIRGQSQAQGINIIDLNSARMATVMFRSDTGRLEVIAGRSLADDFAQAP